MKKVAIVGAQELTRGNAPYNDNSFDIWSFSDWICADWLKRCDGLIEIHNPLLYMKHPRTPDYWEKLQTIKYPVWMYPVADPRVPGAELYPLDGVLDMISSGKQLGKAFIPLNASISYAVALAIFMQYDVIDVYGVEMAHSSQYMSQQPIFAFWNGVAVGKGIELNINCSNGLFIQPLYGFEDTTPKAKINSYMKVIAGQLEEAEKIRLMAEGAKQLAKAILEQQE